MVKSIHDLLKENEELTRDKETLHYLLARANEVIGAIKKGNIDAVFIPGEDPARILVAANEDQTYRRFIENMSEGVVTLSTDGIIVYGNSSFAKIVEVPLEKVIGTNFRYFIPIAYLEHFEKFLHDHSENSSKVELSIEIDDGTRRHFIVSLNRLQLQDFVAVNLVWTDVTDQKKAEENLITVNEHLTNAIEESLLSEKKVVDLNHQLKENIKILEETNNELATFAHIASHDLQEPLRKITTYGNLLIDEYYASVDGRGQTFINIIQRASIRMRHLIKDILEYSQLSQNELSFKPVSLQSIVMEVFSDFEHAILQTKAIITVEKELPVIEANGLRIGQLFGNIISNSLKFIKSDRTPEINITYDMIEGKELPDVDEILGNKQFCRIYIRDNGIGFKQQYINKMFTLFQRLTTTPVDEGTGLGLAVCKKIVDKHHGFITAAGMLNEGSLFTVILPISQTLNQRSA